MKSATVPFLAFAAMLALVTPPAPFAQNIASQTGTVNRNLDHLTLLTGPGLLSPAHGAGLPAPLTTVSTPSFRFGPTTTKAMPAAGAQPPVLRGPGTLTLGSDSSRDPLAPVLRQAAPPPHPDSLRFESNLPATPATLRLQPPPALKRD